MDESAEPAAIEDAAIDDWRMSPQAASALIAKGVGSRVGFSALSALLSLAVLPAAAPAAWFALIVCWEFGARPLLDRTFLAAASRRSRRDGFRALALMHCAGGILYVWLPAAAWTSGAPFGLVLATAWVTASANHTFVYFANHRLLFFANLAPLLACAALAPFSSNVGLEGAEALAALTLGGVVALAGFIGRDRNALMQALAKNKAARVAAENANAFKSRFLAGLGHELRAPLTDILGYAELIEEDAPAAAADARSIRTSANRMLGVVNVVLDIARLESGALTLQPERNRVSALMEQLREAALPVAAQEGARLDIQESGDLGEAEFDHPRLHQALMQLIANAARRAPQGEIKVSAHRRQHGANTTLRFVVQDDGDALGGDAAERIFEPFDNLPDRSPEASLGLSFARQVARLMGGDAIAHAEPRGGKLELWIAAPA